MGYLEIAAAVATTGVIVWSFATVAFGYWLFYNYRMAVSGLAGFAAGTAAGMTTGITLLVGPCGVAGAAAGVYAARSHPRGGSLVTAGAFGFVSVALLAMAYSPVVAVAGGLVGGFAGGLVFAALAWRFPRGALVPATGGVTVFAAYGAFVAVTALPGLEPYLSNTGTDGVVLVGTMAPVSAGLVSLLIQPYVVEYTESVPPLWPERLRQFLGGLPDDRSRGVRCGSCGAIGDPGHGTCHACGATTEYEIGVPSDAVAVDVPCQHCGERPIEEYAEGYQVSGLFIFVTVQTVRVMGCHDCVSSRLRATTKQTAMTGWWSLTAVVCNVWAIVWNLLRSSYNEGPNDNLAKALADAGLPREYLTDRSAFDDGQYRDEELLVDALVQVGTSVMHADGQATRQEAETVVETVCELCPTFDRSEVESHLADATDDVRDVATVMDGVSGLLTPHGREAVLALAAQVAATDGDLAPGEREQFRTLADELDVDIDPVELARSGGVGEYVSVA